MEFDYIAIFLLMVLSIILNSIVVFVLVFHWKTLKNRDIIVLSLAVADLVQSIFGFPYLITDYGRPPSDPATGKCIFSALIVTITAITAICHIVSLSIVFCLFLNFPFIAEKFQYPLPSFLVFVLPCWLYGLLWAVMPLLGWSSYGKETDGGYRCGVNLREHSFNVISYNLCLLFAACIIPVTITTICFFSVRSTFRNLERVAVERNGNESQLNQETRRQEFSLFVLSMIMFAAFMFAWFPYASFVIMTAFNNAPSQKLFDVAAILAKTSSFYNPIIYTFAYKEFRLKAFAIARKLTNQHRRVAALDLPERNSRLPSNAIIQVTSN